MGQAGAIELRQSLWTDALLLSARLPPTSSRATLTANEMSLFVPDSERDNIMCDVRPCSPWKASARCRGTPAHAGARLSPVVDEHIPRLRVIGPDGGQLTTRVVVPACFRRLERPGGPPLPRPEASNRRPLPPALF